MAASIDELARRALTGDSVAWRELFDAMTPRVYGHLRRLGASEDAAAELVQETWLRIVKNLEKYDPARPFEPFIFTISTRLWIDSRRASHRRPPGVPLPEDVAGDDPLPLDLLFAAERVERMQHCLEVLSAEEREIIVLRFWRGMTTAEVGQQVGAATSSIKGRSFRAVRKLADCMDLEQFGENRVSAASAPAPPS